MCVAIYVPANVETPSIETLKKCWDANPDGAGFAIRRTSKDGKFCIEIHKGFMEWEKFHEAYLKHGLEHYKEDLLLHFRITSKGTTCKGNCHPFPFTDAVKTLQSTSVLSNYAMIHNGTLPITPEMKDVSDTMELAARIYKGGFYKNVPQLFNLLEGFVGTSKLAIMDKEKVHLLGEWKEVDGVYYSNTYWQYSYGSRNYRYTSHGYTWNDLYGSWDEYDDDWNDKQKKGDKKKKKKQRLEEEQVNDYYVDLEFISESLNEEMCPDCGGMNLETFEYEDGSITIQCRDCLSTFEAVKDKEGRLEVTEVIY